MEEVKEVTNLIGSTHIQEVTEEGHTQNPIVLQMIDSSEITTQLEEEEEEINITVLRNGRQINKGNIDTTNQKISTETNIGMEQILAEMKKISEQSRAEMKKNSEQSRLEIKEMKKMTETQAEQSRLEIKEMKKMTETQAEQSRAEIKEMKKMTETQAEQSRAEIKKMTETQAEQSRAIIEIKNIYETQTTTIMEKMDRNYKKQSADIQQVKTEVEVLKEEVKEITKLKEHCKNQHEEIEEKIEQHKQETKIELLNTKQEISKIQEVNEEMQKDISKVAAGSENLKLQLQDLKTHKLYNSAVPPLYLQPAEIVTPKKFANFKTHNPKEFLSSIENVYKQQPQRHVSVHEFIANYLIEGASVWWQSVQCEDIQQFKLLFHEQYLGASFLNQVNTELCTGKYQSSSYISPINYLDNILKRIKSSESPLGEKEICTLLINHFGVTVKKRAELREINKFTQLVKLIEEVGIPTIKRDTANENHQQSTTNYNRYREDRYTPIKGQYDRNNQREYNRYNRAPQNQGQDQTNQNSRRYENNRDNTNGRNRNTQTVPRYNRQINIEEGEESKPYQTQGDQKTSARHEDS